MAALQWAEGSSSVTPEMIATAIDSLDDAKQRVIIKLVLYILLMSLVCVTSVFYNVVL